MTADHNEDFKHIEVERAEEAEDVAMYLRSDFSSDLLINSLTLLQQCAFEWY
jgi:hypothetical protein